MIGCMHKKFFDLPEEVYDICNDAGLRGRKLSVQKFM
jgi:hypothetical protein